MGNQARNPKMTQLITIDRSLSQSAMVDLLLPAVLCLKQGGHVVFPTETVYGLCCDPTNEEAIQELYAIKGRSFQNPLTLHISGVQHLSSLVEGFEREEVQRLASVFWPGPLTLVLPKTKQVSDSLTGSLPTVGLRYPSDAVATAFIQACGGVVAGTSANLSGGLAFTSHEDLKNDLVGRVDFILSADDIGGLESTVLDLSEGAKILRPGMVPSELIEKVLGHAVEVCYAQSPTAEAKKYALKASLKLYDATDRVEMLALCSGKKLGVLVLTEGCKNEDWNGKDLQRAFGFADLVVEFVERQRYAFDLYDALHRLDQKGVDVILAPRVEKSGVGAAIMHRLEKSAGMI